MGNIAPMVAQVPPALVAEKPISAVDIRRATLLYTEGGYDSIRKDWQSAVDVDRVVENIGRSKNE